MYDFMRQVVMFPEHIGQVNDILLTLIPKCDDSSYITHFRPIALCNIIYKVVTKIIAQRLKVILPKVVSHSQSSFVPGRHITDNIIILQEMVHSMNYMRGKKGFTILKLDLEKTYDRVEWSFVDYTLELLNIPSWMM